MVKYLLKLDYALSSWFAGKRKNDKIIPGTVYFFSTKVAFLSVIIMSLITRQLGLNDFVRIYVSIIMVSAFVVMKVLEKPVKQIILKRSLAKDYEHLSKSQVYQRRFLALLFLAISLYSMMGALILIFK